MNHTSSRTTASNNSDILTRAPLQDLGGQTSIRPYWRCYYANTAAVIFVVDSTDIERLQTASEELSAMLNEEELKDAALLVFANKQDQPGAKGAGEISEALRLGELRDRNWSIMACSAVDGSGVNEGMDWLVVSLTLRLSKEYYTDVYRSKPSTKTKPGPPMTIFPCASVFGICTTDDMK